MANVGCASSISFFNAAVTFLAAFVLLAPAYARYCSTYLPSTYKVLLNAVCLPFHPPQRLSFTLICYIYSISNNPPSVEHNKRTPVLTIMAAFSPIMISGYAMLAIVTSYSLLRFYHFLKSRLISSATTVALPQPVSAGQTSSFSLYSPFSLLRSRQKTISTKLTPTRSRWSPLSAFLRRLSRRATSPLHLADADHLLPTTMPDSPSAHTHSLIDLPVISLSSVPAATANSRNLDLDRPTRQLPKASSMESLTAYKPLTPVPVMVPLPVHITSPPPPSTPPPPSPTLLISMSDSDIPLVPITPPKRRYTPTPDFSMSSNSSGWPTPPLTGKFPAISPSTYNPSVATTPSAVGRGPRPASPSPTRGTHNNHSLFLSSRNVSSLSLSPRSLYSMQQRRSKSLGGVAVKKISPPQFNFGGVVSQEDDFGEDIGSSVGIDQTRVFSAPALVTADERMFNGSKSKLVTPSLPYPKFHLNSSSSSSSTSSTERSLRSEPSSPSPLTTDSDSPPSSAPLETPRSISNASYSSDIAKPSEYESLLPHPIPLINVDMNTDRVDTEMDDMVFSCGYGLNEKNVVNGWSFDVDVEEPAVNVARVLEDFDGVSVGMVVDGAQVSSLGMAAKMGEEMLAELEDDVREPVFEKSHMDTWGWDEDVEGQGEGWDVETKDAMGEGAFGGWAAEDGIIVSDDVEGGIMFEVAAVKLAKELSHDGNAEVEPEPEEYPDPDLLPLPDMIDVVPPAISICTQDVVLSRKESSECDSAVERATPISLGQTPTPPASPPREAKYLPKGSRSLQDQPLNASVVTSPVAKSPFTSPVDIEAQEDEGVVTPIPIPVFDQDHDTNSLSIGISSSPWPMVLTKEEVEEKVVVLLDKPLVSSPASISFDLPESDEEGCDFTFNIETDGDVAGSGSEYEFKVQVVPPSPCGRVPGWEYGSEDEDELDRVERLDQEIEVEVTVSSLGGEIRDESREVGLDQDVQVEQEVDVAPTSSLDNIDPVAERNVDELEEPCVEEIQIPEEESSDDRLAGSASPPLPETVQEYTPSVTPSAVVASALQPSTSLPGSFPDVAASTTSETKAEPVQDTNTLSSPQPQIRRRTRTPLEEAIARTRSPLEVALAMQLRPGLGSGADPAWMVRFIMVMWGWMFGVVLVPSARP
ncbi:hypothetical protein D9756_008024 [Leucocoprinus leucothites]|uniref:Uncharacterized protein n=1 Tax=Leucocoprinus leucothites TaxID=201217 RepID=A0A8H5D4D9_9AGAR|nr:hypothetical protein D9756_008024 [Leucoagaricus leucothites]